MVWKLACGRTIPEANTVHARQYCALYLCNESAVQYVSEKDLTVAWHRGIIFEGYGAHPCWALHLTRVLVQVKVMCDIEKCGSLQMDNVSRWVTEPCCLLFYSVREFLRILIQQNRASAGVCVCYHVHVLVCVDAFTYALGTSCSTESQGKLCCGTASELLKQSSADKPCILSPRERTRA